MVGASGVVAGIDDAQRDWRGARGGILVAVCVVGVCLAEAYYLRWKLDDSYIAFAYAQNWVKGHGIVFNPGERVEGYTCFLWVAVSALALLIGADIRTWSTVVGALAAAASVLAAWRLTAALAPERLRWGAATTLILGMASPALAWWAASGMETTLFTMLVTIAVWRHTTDGARSIAAPVCLALASMTRPEGWLLSALLCLDALRTGGRRAGSRYVAVAAALFVPYYAWRCWYYGYPFPMTFYAKVGYTSDQLRRGLAYLLDFAWAGAGGLLTAGVALAILGGLPRRTLAVCVFLIVYLAYTVTVGGDVFAYHRFFTPIVPVMTAFAIAGLLWLAARRPARAGARAAVLCAGYCGLFVPAFVEGWRSEVRELRAVHRMERFADLACERIVARTGPEDEIATIAVGQIRYCTGRRVIDMVGLTGRHIAHRPVGNMGSGLAGHEKYDSEYVLARWPKYIVIPNQDFEFPVPAVPDMWAQPLFRTYYVPEWNWYRRVDG